MRPIKTDRSNFTYRGPTPDVMDLPCERTAERMGEGVARAVFSMGKKSA